MSFTDAEEDQIINIVMKYPFIYDTNHRMYKDLAGKEAVWKKIGKQINKTSLDCKKQWKVIRDSYARFRKGTSYKMRKNTRLKRYEQLQFLDRLYLNRAGCSNFCSGSPMLMNESSNEDPLQESPHEQEGIIQDNQYQCVIENHEIKIEPMESTEGNEIIVMTGNNEGNEGNAVQNEAAVSARVNRLRRRFNMEASKHLRMNAKRQFLPTKKKEDDIDLFSRHIGEVLRNLPPLDRAKAKKHLSDVISEYEILAASRLNYT